MDLQRVYLVTDEAACINSICNYVQSVLYFVFSNRVLRDTRIEVHCSLLLL